MARYYGCGFAGRETRRNNGISMRATTSGPRRLTYRMEAAYCSNLPHLIALLSPAIVPPNPG